MKLPPRRRSSHASRAVNRQWLAPATVKYDCRREWYLGDKVGLFGETHAVWHVGDRPLAVEDFEAPAC